MRPAPSNDPPSSPLCARRVLIFLGLYFLLHALARVWLSPSLQTDEAEQVILTQEWRWGYGSQGPLYTWLQAALFAWLGPSVPALAFLKNALLFGTYGLTFLTARQVLRRDDHAALAAAALLFIPHLAWESQRDQTHLVLASALAAGTLFLFVRLMRHRRTGDYLLLGLAAALGLLSKYNFVLFLIGLGLAALIRRESRAALGDWRMLLSLATLLAVLAPHGIWAATHPELLLTQTHTFDLSLADSTPPRWAFGLLDLLMALAEYTPVPALFFVCLWRAPRAPGPDVADASLARLLGRFMLVAVVTCAMMIMVFGVGNLRSRWLQPLLLPLPLYVAYIGRSRLTPARMRLLFTLVAGVGVTVFVVINGTALGARWLGRPHHLNVRYDAFAEHLRGQGFEGGVILSDDRLIAGNLRKLFPESIALVPTLDCFVRPTNSTVLIAWNATTTPSAAVGLTNFCARLLGTWPTNAPRVLEAAGRHGDPRTSRLGFILLPAPGRNLASEAGETASTVEPGSRAEGAMDGHFPPNPVHRWTCQEGPGVFLRLEWDTPHTVRKVRIWDDPSPEHWIQEGYLTLDDGHTGWAYAPSSNRARPGQD